MRLRDHLKQLMKQELLTSGILSSSKYRISNVTSLNADGTCMASVDGTSIIAIPLYPVVQGQEIMIIRGDSGKFSAVPTSPNTPPVEIIHPPFFSGVITYRFAIPENVSGISVPVIRFQDSGNSNLYRFQVTDYANMTPWGGGSGSDEGNSFAFSPNGQYFVITGQDSVSPTIAVIKTYKIGPKLKSSGDIDKPNGIFAISPTLIHTYTQSLPFSPTNPFLYLLDIAVDNQGNFYHLVGKETFDSLTCSFGDVNISAFVDGTTVTPGSFTPVGAGAGSGATIQSATPTVSWITITQIIQPTSNTPGLVKFNANSGSSMGRGCFTGIIDYVVSDTPGTASVIYKVTNENIIELDFYKNGGLTFSAIYGDGSSVSRYQGAFAGSLGNSTLGSMYILDGPKNLLVLKNIGISPFSSDIVDISINSILQSILQSSTSFTPQGVAAEASLDLLLMNRTPSNLFGTYDPKANNFILWTADVSQVFGQIVFNGSSGVFLDYTGTKHLFPLSKTGANTVHEGSALANISPGQSDPLAARSLSTDSSNARRGVFWMAKL